MQSHRDVCIDQDQEILSFELGLGWAVKMKKDDFIGKEHWKKRLKNGPEWEFVIEIEWAQLEKHYRRLALRQMFLLPLEGLNYLSCIVALNKWDMQPAVHGLQY